MLRAHFRRGGQRPGCAFAARGGRVAPLRTGIRRGPRPAASLLRGADGYITRRDIEGSMAHEDGLTDVGFKARHILACFDMDQVGAAASPRHSP